jgi:hypothetical protein
MKIVITSFVMPHELDDLERVLIELNRSSKYIKGENYEFSISMSISDYLINWEESLADKEFFIHKFNKLKKLTDWASNSTFQIREDIMGALQAKRITHKEFTHATHFIWLDTDIVFDERGLAYLENGINTIESNDIKKYIITPEVVKYWDTTWDCVVNENYLDKELDYCKVCNPFTESGVKGDVSVETVSNNVNGQPEFKFGAGWLVVVSKPLLDSIPLPESMGAYGPDDTFLMWGMQKLKQRGEDIYQFKLKNYVVCENFYYRNQSEYDLLIKRINRKDEFLQIAHNAFKSELDKL